MDTRKIQRVGQSTFSISLPKDWVRGHELEKGDKVTVFKDNDGSLRVVPSVIIEGVGKVKEKEYVINSDLCREPKMLERIVVGNYVLGRDSIVITSSRRISSKHIEEVRQATKMLMGLGIIEELTDKIVLQCSIDPRKFPIDNLIKRLYMITSTMHKEAIEALMTFDLELAEDAIRRKNEANMMYWLIIRLLLTAQLDPSIIQSMGLENDTQIIGNGLITKYLETIANCTVNIAKNVIELAPYKDKLKKSASGNIMEMSDLVAEICENAITSIYSRKLSIANEAIESKEILENREEKFIRDFPKYTKDVNGVVYLRNIVWSLRRMAEYGASIAVVAINRYLEKSSKICSPAE